jgi:peroxiredoxin
MVMTDTTTHDELPSMYAYFDLPPGMKAGHDVGNGLAIEVRSNALSPGLNLVAQAPILRANWAGGLHEMTHSGPNPVLSRGASIGIGDAFPDFALRTTDGRVVTRSSLLGRPTVFHLGRVVRLGNACSRSLTTMDELRHGGAAQLDERDINLLVVVPTALDEAEQLVEEWALPYPLAVDPDCVLFEALDCGYMGPPLHAWGTLDDEAAVTSIFRTQETLELPLPKPTVDQLTERAEAARAARAGR